MSSIFVPMVTAPTEDDLNFISSRGYGGYNPCYIVDTVTGSVLPNCVGFTWGRWRMLLNESHNLYTGDADRAWYNTADGYERGQTPKVGAVICFSGGNVSGHTAIVERIIDEDNIFTSNSGYNSLRFWNEIVTLHDDVWERPYAGYIFQGFIYYPKKLITYNDVWFFNRLKKLKRNNGKKRRCY